MVRPTAPATSKSPSAPMPSPWSRLPPAARTMNKSARARPARSRYLRLISRFIMSRLLENKLDMPGQELGKNGQPRHVDGKVSSRLIEDPQACRRDVAADPTYRA